MYYCNSVPPLRLKQSPVAAFMIIACVRGFLLNFGVFHATRNALGFPFQVGALSFDWLRESWSTDGLWPSWSLAPSSPPAGARSPHSTRKGLHIQYGRFQSPERPLRAPPA